jgi:hypothetical protein
MNKAPRGPPPGLANKNGVNPGVAGSGSAVASGASNGWSMTGMLGGGTGGGANRASNSNWQSNTNSGWYSTWLLLKNLTAQVRELKIHIYNLNNNYNL